MGYNDTTKSYKAYDVSYCQEGLPMSALKENGAKCVIIRAGFAESKDVTCDAFVKDCAKNSIPYGFYWYSYAYNVSEAKREAKACIEVIKHFTPSCPIFYDVENAKHYQLSGKEVTNLYVAFCDEIEKAGYNAGVYFNPSMWNKLDKSRISKYYRWLAHYNDEFPAVKSSYLSKTNADIWQYAYTMVNGRAVDINEGYTIMWNDKKPIPDEPKTPEIQKGDKVTVNKGAKFSNGVQPMSFVYDTVFDVQRISTDGTEALIGLDKAYTGWMYVKDLHKVTETEPKPTQPVQTAQTLKVGDKVKVDLGATTYDGRGLASFVYVLKYEVMQINGDRVVIGQNGQITAAVNAKDLKKI